MIDLIRPTLILVFAGLFALRPALADEPTIRATYPVFSQIIAVSYPREFVPVTETTNGPSYLQESVLKGETADNWSQMLTVTGARGAALNPGRTPENVAGYFANQYRSTCPDSHSAVDLGSGGGDPANRRVLILSCGTVPASTVPHGEAMLLIVLKGREDYYTVQWATRGPAQAKPVELSRGEWMERLRRLQPIKLCDPVPGESPPYPTCLGGK